MNPQLAEFARQFAEEGNDDSKVRVHARARAREKEEIPA
jgi:hypothetical protein